MSAKSELALARRVGEADTLAVNPRRQHVRHGLARVRDVEHANLTGDQRVREERAVFSNWGWRRERGTVRTSTTVLMACARSSATTASNERVEWPMVHNVIPFRLPEDERRWTACDAPRHGETGGTRA